MLKFKDIIKKYPHEYKKEIICLCKDEDDLNAKEEFYIGDKYETDTLCLNLKAGGNHAGLPGEKHPLYGVHGEKHPLYGKHHSEETRKKMSETQKGLQAGEKHPFYGKHHSEETRKKMSEANKNPSEETRKKMSEARKGKKWMNNGLQQKYVKSNEINLYIEKGYSFGRLKRRL